MQASGEIKGNNSSEIEAVRLTPLPLSLIINILTLGQIMNIALGDK